MIIKGLRHHREHIEDWGHRETTQITVFLSQKAQKNRISAVYFIHCYSNCYSILKINQLSCFIVSLSHNNPSFFTFLPVTVSRTKVRAESATPTSPGQRPGLQSITDKCPVRAAPYIVIISRIYFSCAEGALLFGLTQRTGREKSRPGVS